MRKELPAFHLPSFWRAVGNITRPVLFLCLLAALSLASRGVVFAATLKIYTPRSGATVFARNPLTHLVLSVEGGGGKVQVRVEKTGKLLDPVMSMEGESATFVHFRLPLEPGSNSFTIVPGNQRLQLNYRPIQAQLYKQELNKKVYLFHQQGDLPKACQQCHDLRESETIEPVGLKEQTGCATCHKTIVNKGSWKHGPVANEQCLDCHERSAKPLRIGFPKGDITKICLTCHTNERRWFTDKHRHGPMIGGCTLCHDPHGSNYRYQLWADGKLQICIACHTDKEDLVNPDKRDRLKYVHNIVLGMGCVACHSPHASNYIFQLRKPINALCTSCHRFLAGKTQGHPVAMHPLTGRKDPRRPGRELACTSCHNPHGSSHQHLLIQTPMGARLCHECHKGH